MWPISIFIYLFIVPTLGLDPIGIINPGESPTSLFQERIQTEGRIVLSYRYGKERVRHSLEFSEYVDFTAKKSMVQIGWIGYEPTKYVASKYHPPLTVTSTKTCSLLKREQNFIPEIDWFIASIFPNPMFKDFKEKSPHLIGPTGSYIAIEKLDNNDGFKSAGTITRNGLTYDVLEIEIKTGIPGLNLKIEVQFPGLLESKMYFSANATVVADKSSDPASSSGGANLLGANMFIDFYNIVSPDEDGVKRQQFEESMILPLGVGCNKLKKTFYPSYPTADSFSMEYEQHSTDSRNFLAYSSSVNLLRRDKPGQSKSIWDIRDGWLYHELKSPDKDGTSCSVIDVSDTNLGSAFRPLKDKQVLPLQFLFGARGISYMGKGSTRGLPCLIYETTLDKPPTLFGISNSLMDLKSSDHIEYQIIFWLWAGKHQADEDLDKHFPKMEFLPATIELWKHDFSLNSVEFIEKLEIFDLHWSIGGWKLKPAEMFMIPSCFNNKDQQVRVQFAIEYHEDGKKIQSGQDVQLMADNRFKIETDIYEQFLLATNINAIHIIHNQILIRPHHISVDILLGEPNQPVKLTYLGEGELNTPKSYKENSYVLEKLAEDDCVLTASVIDQIAMVIYCPETTSSESRCYAIHHESEPTYKKVISSDPHAKTCQVYKFEPRHKEVRNPDRISAFRKVLRHRIIFFYLPVPDDSRKDKLQLFGNVRDFDVSQEVHVQKLKRFSFVVPTPEKSSEDESLVGLGPAVKSFGSSLLTKTEASCERLCDIDAHCRSYSYCEATSPAEYPKCALATLDLRQAEVSNQLKSLTIPSDNLVTIKDASRSYQLKFQRECFIREKNLLNIYRDTQESIHLLEHLADQFPPVISNLECAKQSQELEESSPSTSIAMFAYCPSTRTCILDESFLTAKGRFRTDLHLQELSDEDRYVDDSNDQDVHVERREVSCRIYRKKFETYFELSQEILVEPEQNEQIKIVAQSVEECARACWMQFGSTCASFDYCEPDGCGINRISLHDLPKSRRKTAHSCLHYERNQAYDELRRQGLLGRHQLLLPSDEDEPSRSGQSVLVSLIIYLFAGLAFVFGLALGVRVSEKVDRVKILRQSLSTGAGLRACTLPDFRSFVPPAGLNRGSSFQNEDEDEDSSAIQLSEINKEGDERDGEESGNRLGHDHEGILS